MLSYFVYGTLCHAPLLRTVLGRTVEMVPARLPGHAVFWVRDKAFPVIVEGGPGAAGFLLEGLDAGDAARLDFYEGGFDYETREVTVETAAGPARARAYFSAGGLEPGAPWSLADWQARWGEVAVATAGDFMAQMGHVAPETLIARYPMMLMRGGARCRARREAGAAAGPLPAHRGEIRERRVRQVYAGYFAVEEYDLRFGRFDGSLSPEVNRAVFVSGDAAVVLPYDPGRDRVLLIEQQRMGPHARGDRQSWIFEAVAGRVDGGETPEETARREAREEAGLEIGELIPAHRYYPSPAAMAEYLYTFVGIAELPDGGPRLGGLAAETEDIRSRIVPFATLMAMVESGQANTAPLLLLALWLDRHREGLRARFGAGA